MNNLAYANSFKRFVAYLIDSVILMVINFFVVAVYTSGEKSRIALAGIDLNTPEGRVSSVVVLIYFVALTTIMGATLGKKLMGIKVVDAKTGVKPAFVSVLLREIIGKLISAVVIGIGFLWILFDKKKQGWHDKIANTLVVKS